MAHPVGVNCLTKSLRDNDSPSNVAILLSEHRRPFVDCPVWKFCGIFWVQVFWNQTEQNGKRTTQTRTKSNYLENVVVLAASNELVDNGGF